MNNASDPIILTASVVANVLSIVGCLFNIITTIYLKRADGTTSKMVIYLSIADLITCVVLIPMLGLNMSSNFLCQSLTLIMNFGHGSSFVLTCCFAHALHVVIKSGSENLIKYIKFYQIISITVGSVLGVLSIIAQMSEIVDDMCSLSNVESGFDWGNLTTAAIPLAASVIYCVIVYILFIRQLREMGVRPNLVLLSYPAILIVCYLPYLIYTYIPNLPFWFVFVGRILINSQGLFNSLAYGVSKEVVNEYRNRCYRKSEDEQQNDHKLSSEVNRDERSVSTIEMYGVL